MSDVLINHTHNEISQSGSSTVDLQQKIGTFLLCRNSLVTIALKHILSETPFAIINTALNEDFLPLSSFGMSPALFIIDGSEAPSHVIDTATNLKSRYPEARIAVVAQEFDLGFVRLARGAGIDGFCLSGGGREVLIKSLELIMLGEVVLPASLMFPLLDGAPLRSMLEVQGSRSQAELESWDAGARKLSTRESEILHCLTEGAPNKIIARKLDVAEATVKVHIKAILRKIGAANRTQAAMWATTHLPADVRPSLKA